MIPEPMAMRFEQSIPLLNKAGIVRVISHHDADGILSAAIISIGLRRKGVDFHTSLVKGMDEALIEKLKEEKNEVIIVSDMGSNDIKALEGTGSRLMILDHHKTQIETEAKKETVYINPHHHGINGGYDLCGSMLSFLFVITLDEQNWNLVHYALAGAIGDKQHLGGFKGANARIVGKAIGKGLVTVKRGLLLEGKALDAIATSTDPYFGFEDGESVERILRDLNIQSSMQLNELDNGRMKLLTSALSLRLIKQGARSEALENLVGEVYMMGGIDESVNLLAEYMNACGRVRKETLGFRFCLGDVEAVKGVKELGQDYNERIMNGIQMLRTEGCFKKKNIQFFYCNEPRIAGALASINMQYFPDQDRATFALTVLKGKTKVSSRGSKYLIGNNLDLASACNGAALEVGGKGGGHEIAAGAVIPKGKEDKFLDLVDKAIGEQYSTRESQ
jgi:RecJ-like exonuclease